MPLVPASFTVYTYAFKKIGARVGTRSSVFLNCFDEYLVIEPYKSVLLVDMCELFFFLVIEANLFLTFLSSFPPQE